MAKIESAFFDIGALDALAAGNSPIHRLDARAKLLTTVVFIVAVASFDRYVISALLPFFLFPVSLIALGGLPVGPLAKKLLLVAPFAVLVGALNPLFDRETLAVLGPLEISGGWISFASILLRFTLTVGAALILIATTSFPGVCMALQQLGAPKAFVLQLLLLYRFLFVLIDEGGRLVRARSLRSFGRRGTGMTVFGHLAGQLLLRTLERGRRVHRGMLCRGFDGDLRLLRPRRIALPEIAFTLGWCAFFIALRYGNFPRLFGAYLTELVR